MTAAGIFHGPDLRPAHEVSVDDFTRPMIGVANLHSEITPCNAHLNRLAVKAIEAATLKAISEESTSW